MALRRAMIEERLKELDQILQELGKYRGITWEAFHASLSQQWIIERGLIAAAAVVFDVADHILAGEFGILHRWEDAGAGCSGSAARNHQAFSVPLTIALFPGSI